MNKWARLGEWLHQHSGKGAALIGSLLTGGVPSAIATGAALVQSAAGSTNPSKILATLKASPESMVELERLAVEEGKSIRTHLAAMAQMKLEDQQHEHATTQTTVQAGDKAEDRFVRWCRPGQSWVSLIGGMVYVFTNDTPDMMILGVLLTLSFSYAGLRQVGKGIDSLGRKK